MVCRVALCVEQHAARAYIAAAYRPKGGYVSPEDDDWEKQVCFRLHFSVFEEPESDDPSLCWAQVSDLKEMNKYKTSKKGTGKRKSKK